MKSDCIEIIDDNTKRIQLDFLVTAAKRQLSQKWQDYNKARGVYIAR